MARPETYDDLAASDFTVPVGSMEPTEFQTDARLLRAWAGMLEAAQAAGMRVETSYGRVQIVRPKTKDELDSSLRSRQSTWDMCRQHYEAALAGETLDKTKAYLARRHAVDEGLEVPESVAEALTV